ncbi:MAG TPA: ABC transporter substrate-binding protein [Gaiellaceae bacterium]|jgi:branched-chain amino acid transport system substrate-binding protein
MKKAILACAIAAVAVLGATSASARTDADPGVTDSSILLGGSVPLSGLASGYKSVALGAEAYFKYVNDRGGVNGRTIDYSYLDDAYNPAQTVQVTRQLVDQDHVFAIFNTLGTEDNIAIRDYLKQRGVPQLFVASGAQTWGRDFKQYPTAIGYLPSYVAEGKIYGRYIAANWPTAKLGILFQNDAYTQDLIRGLKLGLGKKAGLIKAQQGYEPTEVDMSPEISRLKGSGVDTVILFALPQQTITAFASMNKLGWKPKHIVVNQVSSASSTMQIAAANAKAQTEVAISTVVFKDPDDTSLAKDPGIKLYRSILAKYAPAGTNPRDVYNVYGMAVAYTMVDALRKAGKNLTRQSLMNAVLHLREADNPFLLKGVVLSTTPNDHFPIKQAQLERWHAGRWIRFGPLVNARG